MWEWSWNKSTLRRSRHHLRLAKFCKHRNLHLGGTSFDNPTVRYKLFIAGPHSRHSFLVSGWLFSFCFHIRYISSLGLIISNSVNSISLAIGFKRLEQFFYSQILSYLNLIILNCLSIPSLFGYWIQMCQAVPPIHRFWASFKRSISIKM